MVKQQTKKPFFVDDSKKAQDFILKTTQRMVADKVLSEAPTVIAPQSSYTIADFINAEQAIIIILNNKALDDPLKVQQIQTKLTTMLMMVPLLLLQPTSVQVMSSSFTAFLDELEDNVNWNAGLESQLRLSLTEIANKLKFAMANPTQSATINPAPLKAMKKDMKDMKDTQNRNAEVMNEYSRNLLDTLRGLADRLDLSHNEMKKMLSAVKTGKVTKKEVAKAVDESADKLDDDEAKSFVDVLNHPAKYERVLSKTNDFSAPPSPVVDDDDGFFSATAHHDTPTRQLSLMDRQTHKEIPRSVLQTPSRRSPYKRLSPPLIAPPLPVPKPLAITDRSSTSIASTLDSEDFHSLHSEPMSPENTKEVLDVLEKVIGQEKTAVLSPVQKKLVLDQLDKVWSGSRKAQDAVVNGMSGLGVEFLSKDQLKDTYHAVSSIVPHNAEQEEKKAEILSVINHEIAQTGTKEQSQTAIISALARALTPQKAPMSAQVRRTIDGHFKNLLAKVDSGAKIVQKTEVETLKALMDDNSDGNFERIPTKDLLSTIETLGAWHCNSKEVRKKRDDVIAFLEAQVMRNEQPPSAQKQPEHKPRAMREILPVEQSPLPRDPSRKPSPKRVAEAIAIDDDDPLDAGIEKREGFRKYEVPTEEVAKKEKQGEVLDQNIQSYAFDPFGNGKVKVVTKTSIYDYLNAHCRDFFDGTTVKEKQTKMKPVAEELVPKINKFFEDMEKFKTNKNEKLKGDIRDLVREFNSYGLPVPVKEGYKETYKELFSQNELHHVHGKGNILNGFGMYGSAIPDARKIEILNFLKK